MVTHHFGKKKFMNEKASGGLALSYGFCGVWGWPMVNASILGMEVYLSFYVGECHQGPKILVMGQSNGSF
jgi:hypothetical protein